jgi:FkbM family methyltransferase
MSSVKLRSPYDCIVHVGAHLGQEFELYEELVGPGGTVIWIEADPLLSRRLSKIVALKSKVATHLVIEGLIGSKTGDLVELNLFNNDGASNSVLKLDPDIDARFVDLEIAGKTVPLRSLTLDSALIENGANIDSSKENLLVLDVQGYELQVLQGISPSLMACFAGVILEVTRKVKIYEGGADFESVRQSLGSKGFVTKSWIPRVHGDVYFARIHTAADRRGRPSTLI